jgi:hypothetical protein
VQRLPAGEDPPGEYPGAPASVELVAQHRMTGVGQVHPDLVGAPGPRLHLDLEGLPALPGVALQHPVDAFGLLAAFHSGGEALPVHRVPPETGPVAPLDGQFARVRTPAAECDIHLADLVAAELAGQAAVGGIVLGNHHNAGGVPVQPVYDPGAPHPADSGKIPAMVQQRVHQGAVGVAGRRVDHQARGLVDDQQVGVLVQHGQRQGLGAGLGIGKRRLAYLHPFAGPDPVSGPLAAAVHKYMFFIDKLLQIGSGEGTDGATQKDIQALPGGIGVDGDGAGYGP